MMSINKYNVEQGKYIITENNNILTTGGLATCTGLSMTLGKYKFLAHIDASTEIEPIIKELMKYSPNDITNIVIWKGSGFGVSNSDYTSTLAKKILSSLDIEDISMDSIDIIDLNDKVQCNICKQLSGTAKVLSHYYTCKYKSKIEINFVSFMDAVSI